MQKMFRESSDLAARHELDRLSPSSAISVGLAHAGASARMVAIARRESPASMRQNRALRISCSRTGVDFVFQRGGNLLGGIAFLISTAADTTRFARRNRS